MYGCHLEKISIHTTRVGGDVMGINNSTTQIKISIHTTRVGGDTQKMPEGMSYKISIHTTRVGGDCFMLMMMIENMLFQSTPPVWVVTNNNFY